MSKPTCKLCGLEDGACICAHLRSHSSAASEPAGWLVERPGDSTFPRLFRNKASADALVEYVNVNPPATSRPVFLNEPQPSAGSDLANAVMGLENYVNNPSAWEHFDDEMSERLRPIVEMARHIRAVPQRAVVECQCGHWSTGQCVCDPAPQEVPETISYQRRNIGPDGTPWSGWYPANDEPTPENMKFDGYLSYEYRPLYAGRPLPRPQSETGK